MTVRQRRLAACASAALLVSLVALTTAASALGPNVIYNGGFSHGLHGWSTVTVTHGSDPGYPHVFVLRAPVEPMLKCDRSQAGHPFLEMDVPASANAYVEQAIIVPVEPSRLTFRAWGDQEPVKVSVSIVDGPFVHHLLSFKPPTLLSATGSCSGHRPVGESLNMAPYAGQAVGLRVRASASGLSGPIADFEDFFLASR